MFLSECVKRIGVRKEQKPETASNGSEGKKLNTQAAFYTSQAAIMTLSGPDTHYWKRNFP